MPIYTSGTYKALLEQLLAIGVEQCFDNVPPCPATTEGHDWQLREHVTLTFMGEALTVPWAIQCTQCNHSCCLQASWIGQRGGSR